MLVAEPRFAEQNRLKVKLNEIGRAFALDHQLAGFVEREADFLDPVLRAEMRIRHVPEHVAALLQVRLELGGFVSG